VSVAAPRSLALAAATEPTDADCLAGQTSDHGGRRHRSHRPCVEQLAGRPASVG